MKRIKIVKIHSAQAVDDTAFLVDENNRRWNLYIEDGQLRLHPLPKLNSKGNLRGMCRR